jgi:hypothetical protein
MIAMPAHPRDLFAVVTIVAVAERVKSIREE